MSWSVYELMHFDNPGIETLKTRYPQQFTTEDLARDFVTKRIEKFGGDFEISEDKVGGVVDTSNFNLQ